MRRYGQDRDIRKHIEHADTRCLGSDEVLKYQKKVKLDGNKIKKFKIKKIFTKVEK